MILIPPFITQRLSLYEGCTLGQLHQELYGHIPKTMTKGLTGRLIERLLGVTNLNSSSPDLPELGLELKTLPLSPLLQVKEHTFISTISLPFWEGSFKRSRLHNKIQSILWIPIIRSGTKMSLLDRIGKEFLIRMDLETSGILEQDWNLLTGLLRQEQYTLISSHLGEILHIRPKAQSSAHFISIDGQQINPMGFYFRKSYTQGLVDRCLKSL